MTDLPDRLKIIELVKEARASGARLIPICEELEISVRTYERWIENGEIQEDKRPTAERPSPANKLSNFEVAKILKTVNDPKYSDMPPSQIVPALADEGKFICSESTMYRVIHNAKQQNHRGCSKKPVKRVITTHLATGPNQLWSWDITWLPGFILGMYFKLYLILDIYSRKIVGWEIWEEERGEYAAELVQRAVISEKTYGRPLVLHSDNGSPMKSATLLATLENLGVAASYSRPRVSNDNPYSESIFRTCKYRPDYPYKGFTSIEKAREWVMSFVYWYNNVHHHSGIKFVTPNERHNGKAIEIIANREKVYMSAKVRNPLRWARNIRNWSLPEMVALNPTNEIKIQVKKAS
jgi:putative transposase